MFNTRGLALTLLTTVFTFHQLSYAQKVEKVGDASVVTYEKEYFSKYNAVTLLDMLKTIPGAQEILNKNKKKRGDEDGGYKSERGFGSSGDQILINGKRLAGKTNSVDDTLGRISANQIEKIEIIRGAASGLDVQSQGLIINVILAAGASTSTTFWQLSNRYTIHHENQPGFLVSHSGSKEKLDYTFSVERKIGGMNSGRIEEIFDADDVKTADHFVEDGFEYSSIEFVTNLSYNFAEGSVLRLNGLYGPGKWTGVDRRDKTSDILRPQIWHGDGDVSDWEVGGDCTKNLGVIGAFKALFLLNGKSLGENLNRFKGTGEEKFEYSIERSPRKSNERIFRASLTKKVFKNHTLEWGGEAAFNKVHREFISSERDATGGEFVLVNSDIVDIKENRYEVFVNHTYDVSPKMVIQSSLTSEFSKIIADNIFAGGEPTKRDTSFTYLKPRINLRYDLGDRDQLRATVEKKVSQLDFDNFVTSYDRDVDLVRTGNTEIRPEQIWEFSAQYEHRFPNDGGSFDVEIFYHKY